MAAIGERMVMNLFRKWIERRQVRAAFKGYVSEEALRKLENPDALTRTPLSLEKMVFALIQVRDDTAEDIQRNLTAAIDVVLNEGAMIESVLSSYVAVSFDHRSSMTMQRMPALAVALGPNARSVYQGGEYLRGIVGSDRYFSYGSIIPRFGALFEELHRLEFGASKEIV